MRLSEALMGLGSAVSYYPKLARFLGSVPAAIFLAQLFYWQDKQAHTYLYKTAAELEEELGLSPKVQSKAREVLVQRGIVAEHYARLQHEMRFTLNIDRLDKLWSAYERGVSMSPKRVSRTAQTSRRELSKGRVPKRPKGSSIPENTPKTTQESTSSPPLTPIPGT